MTEQTKKIKTELTEKEIEEFRNVQAQAMNELLGDKGNVAFLHASINKFIEDMKTENRECEPAAYMMSGAVIGYTLCKLNNGGGVDDSIE